MCYKGYQTLAAIGATFSGAEPVYNIEEFLSHCGRLGFLVFKDYQCATKHNISRYNNQDKSKSDSISIISVELQEALLSALTFKRKQISTLP